MASQKRRVPRLCFHRSNGYAYVTDPRTRRQIYLGPIGSTESNIAYSEWIQEFLRETAGTRTVVQNSPNQIGELVGRWLEYCERTYRRRDGRPTGELGICSRAAELLGPLADVSIREMTRAHLLSIRDELIAQGQARQTIKHYISRIIRCFKYGALNEWVPEDLAIRLAQLPALRADQGRRSAVVRGIPWKHCVAIYRHLQNPWKSIFAWHLLTGQRVETALSVSRQTLDMTRTPWIYSPLQHKGLAKGFDLHIMVGPKARNVLAPYLQAVSRGLLFPGRHAIPGTTYRGPRQYSGYAAAMATACRRAGIPHYTPRQLRHTAAEFLVGKGVSEAIIGAILGHTDAKESSSVRTGSTSITGRYAAVPRRRVEAVVEKWG